MSAALAEPSSRLPQRSARPYYDAFRPPSRHHRRPSPVRLPRRSLTPASNSHSRSRTLTTPTPSRASTPTATLSRTSRPRTSPRRCSCPRVALRRRSSSTLARRPMASRSPTSPSTRRCSPRPTAPRATGSAARATWVLVSAEYDRDQPDPCIPFPSSFLPTPACPSFPSSSHPLLSSPVHYPFALRARGRN